MYVEGSFASESLQDRSSREVLPSGATGAAEHDMRCADVLGDLTKRRGDIVSVHFEVVAAVLGQKPAVLGGSSRWGRPRAGANVHSEEPRTRSSRQGRRTAEQSSAVRCTGHGDDDDL